MISLVTGQVLNYETLLKTHKECKKLGKLAGTAEYAAWPLPHEWNVRLTYMSVTDCEGALTM